MFGEFMIKYHFTNDLRIYELKQNLISAANYAKYKKWNHPSQLEWQAKNGWLPVYNLYFGLEKDSNNTNLILNNQIEYVIGQFIKKFQYPNPKRERSGAFDTQISEGYCIAPLRILLKVLYYNQFLNIVSEITISHFKNYILAEDDVIKNNKSIPEILELINDDSNPEQFSKEVEITGGDEKRFVNQLLSVLETIGFIKISKTGVMELQIDDLSRSTRDIFFDIVTADEDLYWTATDLGVDKDPVASYIEYINTFEHPLSEDILNISADIFHVPECEKRPSYVQEIHFGAPGTGKSHGISEIVRESYSDYSDEKGNPFVLRTTIHSEYSYYDFIGSILPESKDGEISYQFVPGIFTKSLERALGYPDNDVFLIIEEMSRGNIASIFGDTFQLLDRNENGRSAYLIDNSLISNYLQNKRLIPNDVDKVCIPSNLHIIGTVNTSDQNVNVIDTAFKRRFNFVYKNVEPEYDESGNLLNSFTFKIGTEEYEWNCFYKSLNKFIVEELELSDDKQIGQFFVRVYGGSDSFTIIKNKVLHYLWEDIQKASLKDIKLFNSDIKSFSKLFNDFSEAADPKDIFSDVFINIYDEIKEEFEKSDKELGKKEDSEQIVGISSSVSDSSSESVSTSVSDSSSESISTSSLDGQ